MTLAFSISPYVENMRLTPDAAAEAKIGARKMRQKIRIAAENEIGVGMVRAGAQTSEARRQPASPSPSGRSYGTRI